jgi:hypothetical protein
MGVTSEPCGQSNVRGWLPKCLGEVASIKVLQWLERSRHWFARQSPIPLRLIVGFGFMQHGFAKLSRGPDAFAAILQAMHVPSPHRMAWLVILTELLGGLAVLVVGFVALASVSDDCSFTGGICLMDSAPSSYRRLRQAERSSVHRDMSAIFSMWRVLLRLC